MTFKEGTVEKPFLFIHNNHFYEKILNSNCIIGFMR